MSTRSFSDGRMPVDEEGVSREQGHHFPECCVLLVVRSVNEVAVIHWVSCCERTDLLERKEGSHKINKAPSAEWPGSDPCANIDNEAILP